MKLRSRLFTSHVAMVAVGAALTAACALVSFHEFVIRSNQADLAARTVAIATNLMDWLEAGDLRHVELITQRYGAQEDVWIRVFRADGSLLATSSPDEDRLIADWRAIPGVRAALAGRSEAGVAPGVGSSDDRLYEAIPLERGGHRLGAVRMSRTLASLRQQDLRTAVTVTSALLLVLLLATVASFYLARRLASPIRRMRDFAAEIGEGRFGGRLTVGSNDELAELASSLTAMSARLRDIDNDRRTFLARASHELRTPVTNVQALLEALDEGAVDDLQLRKQFLTSALKETQRMAALVRDLLNLGQLEAGMQSMEARPIDLRRLVEGTLQPLLPRLEAAGVRASIDGTEAVQLAGDPDRLQRALLNVLDNALKHAPAGSEIAVRGREAEGYAVIVVTDRGPGFSTAELPRVFEQFFTGGDGGRGSGLGLAIARTIVDAHGGTITAGNDPAGGAVITIRLPLRRSGAGGPVRDLQSRIG